MTPCVPLAPKSRPIIHHVAMHLSSGHILHWLKLEFTNEQTQLLALTIIFPLSSPAAATCIFS